MATGNFGERLVTIATFIAEHEALNATEKQRLLARLQELSSAHFDDMQETLANTFLSLGISLSATLETPTTPTTDETP